MVVWGGGRGVSAGKRAPQGAAGSAGGRAHLGALVVQVARHAGQRGELVGCRHGLCASELGEHGGLAHGGEANERHARVAHLLHVKARACRAAGAGALQELRAQLGKLGLELPQVVLGGLVALRARHLRLQLLDALQDAGHGGRGGRAGQGVGAAAVRLLAEALSAFLCQAGSTLLYWVFAGSTLARWQHATYKNRPGDET